MGKKDSRRKTGLRLLLLPMTLTKRSLRTEWPFSSNTRHSYRPQSVLLWTSVTTRVPLAWTFCRWFWGSRRPSNNGHNQRLQPDPSTGTDGIFASRATSTHSPSLLHSLRPEYGLLSSFCLSLITRLTLYALSILFHSPFHFLSLSHPILSPSSPLLWIRIHIHIHIHILILIPHSYLWSSGCLE